MIQSQAINVLTFRRNFLGAKDEEERLELMVGFITQGQTTEIAEKILESEKVIKAEIHGESSRLEGNINKLDTKIDAVESKLDAKIDAVESRLDAKIGALDAKIDAVEARLDAKIDYVEKTLRAEIISTKHELLGAISASANKNLIWTITFFMGIAGLVVAFLRLK